MTDTLEQRAQAIVCPAYECDPAEQARAATRAIINLIDGGGDGKAA